MQSAVVFEEDQSQSHAARASLSSMLGTAVVSAALVANSLVRFQV
jgi:hypothetical protein